MTETAFCPGPSCQKVQPVLVGEDGGRRCGYCKRVLSASLPEEHAAFAAPPADRLPRQFDALANEVRDLSDWRARERIVRRLEVLEARPDVREEYVGALEATIQRSGIQLTQLEERVNGLTAVVGGLTRQKARMAQEAQAREEAWRITESWMAAIEERLARLEDPPARKRPAPKKKVRR